ncbi:hypothetical protein JST97_10410 [bacterium]|nr:hypothetical protein [bacterium]
MASDYIQRLLEEGRPGPSGVFSLDLSRVELVFSNSGQDWLHYWLRLARFYTDEPFQVEWDGHRFCMSFSGGPDAEGLRSLLLDRRRGPRYLALGVLAAARQGFTQIELESPWGFLSLQGQGSRLDENRRSRDGCSHLRALHARGLNWPESSDFQAPYRLNGQIQKASEARGLRLIVDGWAFAARGNPLIPPGETLDWRLERVDLDALLLNPRLETEQIQELQSELAARLLSRSQWTPETVEWLLLRNPQWLARLPAPPRNHPLYPAYRERQAWLLGQSPEPQLWSDWPDSLWPALLDQGLAPFALENWLEATCRRLPGRAIYPYLLRCGWRGEHPDPHLLSALLAARQDQLGGHIMLARQLSFLKPAQRPAQATRFCTEFLQAALAGRECTHEWSALSAAEQAKIERMLRENL